MRPAFVMVLLVVAQVGGSAATMGAQKISLVIGRVQVCIAFRLIGAGMLIAIALSPLQKPELIIPLYLLRQWFVQSPIGLSKSVLNDYASKKHRAKWNALDSINTSSWAGSAVLGGFLADKFGSYRPVFLVTAGLSVLASLLNVPLLLLVALEDRDEPSARAKRGISSHMVHVQRAPITDAPGLSPADSAAPCALHEGGLAIADGPTTLAPLLGAEDAAPHTEQGESVRVCPIAELMM